MFMKMVFYENGILTAGVGKLRSGGRICPATNFCAARESLKQIIQKKLFNVEERDKMHFYP